MAEMLALTSIFTIVRERKTNGSATTTDAPRKPSQYMKQFNCKANLPLRKSDISEKVTSLCRELATKRGIHSYIAMKSAGFEYTNNGDQARCSACGLEVSEWTSDMKPFATHSQRSPECSFVLSISPSHMSTSTNKQKSSQALQMEKTNVNHQSNIFVEVDTIKQVRKRTFSQWSHRASPSASQMIDAGFFNCNVGDRVICIYCNILCQQWIPHSDDPCQVHKTLSPKCPYVITMLNRSQTLSTSHIQNNSSYSDLGHSGSNLNETAFHKTYVKHEERRLSYFGWTNNSLPSVDDLAKAGFFFTGTKTIVTCFYCNGSLQNWGPNNNPTIEHARWFPHCAYARQLCGAELYQEIQEAKRARLERTSANRLTTSSDFLVLPGEIALARLVADRLDWPISHRLRNQQFNLSIIRRCWEDQLLLKKKDFVNDCDLFMACKILQKQIEHINGNRENIIVPSIAMAKIRDREIREHILPELQTHDSSPTNPCVLCSTNGKRLACMPCGHLLACSHDWKLACSVCHREIEALVRIYI